MANGQRLLSSGALGLVRLVRVDVSDPDRVDRHGRADLHATKGTSWDWADKFTNAVDEAKGKVKEIIGKATANRRMETEGKADQAKARVKKAAEKVKDTIKDALD